jgi:hypothetical protein
MNRLKKIFIAFFIGCMLLTPPQQAEAAGIAAIVVKVIKEGVKKVIKAIDLKIQRLQNKTIWLQNAQKVLENTMSKLKLDEISDWTERQRDLYQEYFEELRKVKVLISYYQRIKEITEIQKQIVKEYQHAWQLVRQDDHFSSEELDYIESVYGGILEETLKNIDQLILVINSFKTQMSDAERLEIIGQVADRVELNYTDIRQFNRENYLLSLSRAKDAHEIETIRKLYGL